MTTTVANHFDVIVIGGGHAGTEAAAAAARMGAKTMLLTHKVETVGVMSCNPAIGGLGKGHLVREIDALDGVMGRAIDRAGIQFRMLNASRGYAVRGPRAQADRKLYRNAVQDILGEYSNLTVRGGGADDLIRDPATGRITGVLSGDGVTFTCGAVVLTTGTFLRGVIHRGTETSEGGRIGEAPTVKLAHSIEALGLSMGRLKTGTPARLNGRTINWTACTEQPGDTPPQPFSFMNTAVTVPQISCYITHTSTETHQIIRDNLHLAPMYSGQIQSVGPRYCPSIEDKIVRFADKDRHQIFLEPEGLDDDTVYPNGISTSFGPEIQEKIIRSIKGLEHVEILQYAYAIEYDYVDPRQLDARLGVRSVDGLFLAGQINGTTGYEEAGAQGIVAGINAALSTRGDNQPAFTLGRDQAYIGVMIDDLITRGAPEPYRMFTSRAEYRLSLRADNADQRLTPAGIEIGCVGAERQAVFTAKMSQINALRAAMDHVQESPTVLAGQHGLPVNQDGVRRSAFDLLRYPTIQFADLVRVWPDLGGYAAEIVEQVEIDARYAGYLERQEADIAAFNRDENLLLPSDLDYAAVGGLSTELRLKLEKNRPASLGAAGRISGMTPSALTALLRYVRKKNRDEREGAEEVAMAAF